MIKQTISYTNFDDEEVTEDFYFNFTLLEIVEQIEVNGLEKKMQLLTKTEDGPGAYKIFKGIVLDAYGHKSADGRMFHKSPEIRADFESSAAISEMIIGFLQDEGLGIAFIGGLLPQDKMEQALAKAEAKKAGTAGIQPAQTVPVAPTLQSVPQPAQDVVAAQDERIVGATPVQTDVTMSTAEKRQYTQEELDAITGQQNAVPMSPDMVTTPINQDVTDEELLEMDARKMTPAQLQRAYMLRSQQQS